MARLKLLAFVAERPRRSTDIASFFDQAPRTVTGAVDWLEKNDLVVRVPVPGDRRAKLVQITERGRGMLEDAQPLYEAIVERTFGALPAGELDGLAAALARLQGIVEALEQREARSGPRGISREVEP